jgi:myo-inositol 2-dehydrogenase / D-chiro-inositol 1-dehydrogenase
MDDQPKSTTRPEPLARRDFLSRAGAAALSLTILPAGLVRGAQAAGRIRLGVIGCGGRGSWIAALFRRHGGYEITAAADYFPDRVDAFGAAHGVPTGRRFTGLSAYKRLLESGLDAVAIESPPYFHPEQAAAAVDAGVHVYLAKPAAVDVPGTLSIEQSAARAAEKKRVFLVDFQTRTNPYYIEAVRRVREGGLGDIVFGEALYHADCPFESYYDLWRGGADDAESRLRGWGLDRALSGDMITEQDIHALDVMSWIMDVPPVLAHGTGGLRARPRLGTCWDHFVVYYQYPGPVGMQFSGRQFKGHGTTEGIRNRIFGARGVLETEYGGSVLIRGENFYRGGKTTAIFEEGAAANIAAFHKAVLESDFSQPTAAPSVRSNLVTLLGRKAALENRPVRWEELLRDDEKLAPLLKGLKD